jgi:hypothetical protein
MKRNWQTFLLIGVVVSIVLTTIFRLLTPKKPEIAIPVTPAITTNFDSSVSQISNLRYTGSDLVLPEKVIIAQVKIDSAASEQLADTIRTEYQLEKHPNSKVIWQTKNYQFVKNVPDQEYSLLHSQDGLATTSDNKTPAESTNSPLDIQAAETTATAFLSKLMPNNTLSFIRDSAVYYKSDGSHYEAVPAVEATVVELSYTWKINNYPIFLPQQSKPPVRILVGKTGTIEKFVFPFLQPTIVSTEEVEPISVKTAFANLNNGIGSVISAHQDTTTPFTVAEIKNGTLNAVQLEYRIDANSNIIFPNYRFFGKANNDNNDTYTVELLTPAVATAPSH